MNLTKKKNSCIVNSINTIELSQVTEETPDTGRYVQVQIGCQSLPRQWVGRKDK